MRHVEIRKACMYDLEHIMNIQTQCYKSDLIEDYDVFKGILQHDLSFVAEYDGGLIGYLLVHFSKRDTVPLLHSLPSKKEYQEDNTLFIHDMSVLPTYQCNGIGRNLIIRFEETRTTATMVQLIAVNGAQNFWKKIGFEERTDKNLSKDQIANYGGFCVFMEKWIQPIT